MKTLIVGSAGHLGSYLKTENSINYTDSIDSISTDYLLTHRPGVIINCAAKTEMIWAESNEFACRYVNFSSPLELYKRVCKSLNSNCLFIQISSGCIWDGPLDIEGKPFNSKSFPNPLCVYTKSKVDCEWALKAEYDNQKNPASLCILRPRLIFSEEKSPRNLLCKLLNYEHLIDDYNSFTSCSTIKSCIDTLSKYYYRQRCDTYNVYDVGVSTPFNIGMKLYTAGLRDKPKLLDKSKLDHWHKPKRVNVILSDLEFEKEFNPQYLEMSLDNCIKSLATKLGE